jgi:hypothetical protein
MIPKSGNRFSEKIMAKQGDRAAAWSSRLGPPLGIFRNSGVLKMKKTVFATAAILAISGSAFAGSDNYGSNGANQPAAAVDSSYTASVQNSASAQNPVPADEKPVHGSDRNLFGNN